MPMAIPASRAVALHAITRRRAPEPSVTTSGSRLLRLSQLHRQMGQMHTYPQHDGVFSRCRPVEWQNQLARLAAAHFHEVESHASAIVGGR